MFASRGQNPYSAADRWPVTNTAGGSDGPVAVVPEVVNMPEHQIDVFSVHLRTGKVVRVEATWFTNDDHWVNFTLERAWRQGSLGNHVASFAAGGVDYIINEGAAADQQLTNPNE